MTKASLLLLRDSRTTDSPRAATFPNFLIRLAPRPAACALLQRPGTHPRRERSAY
jgi:hypothetical protein